MMTTSFTPFTSLAGGVLIGIAAVALMALHGRIAGMTGILKGVLPPFDQAAFRLNHLNAGNVIDTKNLEHIVIDKPVTALSRHALAADWRWRAMFLAGAVAAPVIYRAVSGTSVEFAVPSSLAALVLGGALVGVGVSFGGGCTSGHGVCGIARLSARSIVATGMFMATAFLTVFITRHVL